LISVIIPTLNEEGYIEKTLRCLVNQDFDKPYEIIVVDSMSEDRTAEIAREYGARVIEMPRMGPGLARNLGAKKAKYDILLFMDADAIIPKHALRRVYEAFNYKKVIAAYAPYIFDNPKYYRPMKLANMINDFCLRFKIPLGILPAVFTAVRKDAFFKVGGFRSAYPRDDWHLTRKLMKLDGYFYKLRDVLVIASSRRVKERGFIGTAVDYFLGSTKRYKPYR